MAGEEKQDIEMVAGVLADLFEDMAEEARGALLIRTGQLLEGAKAGKPDKEQAGLQHTATVLKNAGAMYHSPGFSRAVQLALSMKGAIRYVGIVWGKRCSVCNSFNRYA